MSESAAFNTEFEWLESTSRAKMIVVALACTSAGSRLRALRLSLHLAGRDALVCTAGTTATAAAAAAQRHEAADYEGVYDGWDPDQEALHSTRRGADTASGM